jgi:hypothetical protein
MHFVPMPRGSRGWRRDARPVAHPARRRFTDCGLPRRCDADTGREAGGGLRPGFHGGRGLPRQGDPQRRPGRALGGLSTAGSLFRQPRRTPEVRQEPVRGPAVLPLPLLGAEPRAGLPRPRRRGRAVPADQGNRLLQDRAVGEVRRRHRLRPEPSPRLREPHHRGPARRPADAADDLLHPAVRCDGARRTHQGRSAGQDPAHPQRKWATSRTTKWR